MLKTLRNALRTDKEALFIPRTVQQTIPIKRVWPDGIFLVGNRYSMSWRFSDINFSIASEEDKESIHKRYCEVLNALDTGATTKITVNNRRINKAEFERDTLFPLQGDDLDPYREEYNAMLLERATSSSHMMQERYITVSAPQRNIEEARLYFNRLGVELRSRLSSLGSKCEQLDGTERLRIFHDFHRSGQETEFSFDFQDAMTKGFDFKDTICPESMEYHSDYLMLGDKYARVLFCQAYPSILEDDLISNLTALSRNIMLSIDIIPIPTDEAVREVEAKLLGVETNITNWQRKQNQSYNFAATVPYDMEQQRTLAKQFLDDLTTRDQRMMCTVLTLVHTADSKQELDSDTKLLRSTAQERGCQFTTLRYQQMEGLHTALPYGLRKIDTTRTLLSEGAGILMPFYAQSVVHKDGIYHGISPINKNMIFVDRRQLMNGNGCILGVSGAGKSFFAKMEIVPLLLKGGVDILIIDPEREYVALTQQLGGEVVHISAASPHHINVMDMARGYGDEADSVIFKSEFIQSLFQQLYMDGSAMDNPKWLLSPNQKSILDRCVAQVYREYIRSGYTIQPPTLYDLYHVLREQPEPESKALALDLEMYVIGSLNTFAQPTNVDLTNNLIDFDIRELGSSLQALGMLVVLDAVYNRLLTNQSKGRETWIFIDEAYLLFRYPYSADFFYKLWKRIRKQNGFATAVTQNIGELLQSETAKLMLANSEYLVMLNQAASDREELAYLLGIPDTQLSYVRDAPQGQGILKCGSAIVPFIDQFPTHTKLYSLMTTKPSDKFLSTEKAQGETHDKHST